jgi:hypothetical protein
MSFGPHGAEICDAPFQPLRNGSDDMPNAASYIPLNVVKNIAPDHKQENPTMTYPDHLRERG